MYEPEIWGKELEEKRGLLVLLHGYGASGPDLAPVGHWMGHRLKDFLVWTPSGLDPWEGGGKGRQWFSLKGLEGDGGYEVSRLSQATDLIQYSAERFGRSLEVFRENYGMREKPLFLGGFSQGAMMALALGLYQVKSQGVLAWSGGVVPGKSPTYRPPVLGFHGALDRVLPLSFLHHTVAWLKNHEVPCQASVLPGMGHEITPSVLERSLSFIKDRV